MHLEARITAAPVVGREGVPKAMMPGAPPVRLESPTAMRSTPFSRNDSVLPTAISFSCVPAARRSALCTSSRAGSTLR